MASNRLRCLRALLVIPLAFPLIAALNVLVEEPPNTIMADGGSVAPGTEVTVTKGEIFYRQPLGRSQVAALEAQVAFTFLGQPVVIGTGDQLLRSTISGRAAGLVWVSDALYCTPAKRTGKKRVVGMSEVSAVGMDLDAISRLRHVQVQSCLIDKRNDGTVDQAFIADTSNRQEIVPVAIAPTRIRQLGTAPMPGESEARMRFDGPVGIIGNMSTTLEIVEEGNSLKFGNAQTLFRGSLPHTVETFGASFTILSYDRDTKSAQIRIDRPFAPIEYGVHTQIVRR
jgi:hypothetical protein